jgi:hypothetical protein
MTRVKPEPMPIDNGVYPFNYNHEENDEDEFSGDNPMKSSEKRRPSLPSLLIPNDQDSSDIYENKETPSTVPNSPASALVSEDEESPDIPVKSKKPSLTSRFINMFKKKTPVATVKIVGNIKIGEFKKESFEEFIKSYPHPETVKGFESIMYAWERSIKDLRSNISGTKPLIDIAILIQNHINSVYSIYNKLDKTTTPLTIERLPGFLKFINLELEYCYGWDISEFEPIKSDEPRVRLEQIENEIPYQILIYIYFIIILFRWVSRKSDEAVPKLFENEKIQELFDYLNGTYSLKHSNTFHMPRDIATNFPKLKNSLDVCEEAYQFHKLTSWHILGGKTQKTKNKKTKKQKTKNTKTKKQKKQKNKKNKKQKTKNKNTKSKTKKLKH